MITALPDVVIEPSTGVEVDLEGLAWEEKLYASILATERDGWKFDGDRHDSCLMAMAAKQLGVAHTRRGTTYYHLIDIAEALGIGFRDLYRIYGDAARLGDDLDGAKAMVRKHLNLDENGRKR